ncbi:hypothetical protein DL96DRAFT_1798379 [Flagelloscypha sp. PMI_526]|nr:hypothetical protein DL96DRAFT_1798379 [Flagelloscypha sp. PMI_526]
MASLQGPRPLQRRCTQSSTKELIGQWESVSSLQLLSFTPPPKAGQSTKSNEVLTTPAESPFVNSKKSKSPIRQSIKNFIAVLKKSRNNIQMKDIPAIQDDNISDLPPSLPIKDAPDPPTKNTLALPTKDTPLLPTKSTPALSARETFVLPTKNLHVLTPTLETQSEWSTIPPKLNCSLYYLDRHPPMPCWRQVTAEFHETNLLVLSWPGYSQELDKRVIFLEGCSDVQSISVDELLHPPPDMLLKPFTILFPGARKEVFSACTALDRSHWVNRIWNSIISPPTSRNTSLSQVHLPTQELGTPTITCQRFSEPNPGILSPSSSRCQNKDACNRRPSFSSSRLTSHSPSTKYCPPSPSVYPPTRPASRISVNSIRSKSPSIANLSSKSIVKKRLADLQTDVPRLSSPYSSQTSRPSDYSFTSSSRTLRSAREQPSPLYRQASTSEKSILERYNGEAMSHTSSSQLSGVNNLRTLLYPTQESENSNLINLDVFENAFSTASQGSRPNDEPSKEPLQLKLDNIKSAIERLPGAIHANSIPPGLANIDKELKALDSRAEASQAALESIQARIDDLSKKINEPGGEMSQTLENIVAGVGDIRGHVPTILRGIEAIQAHIRPLASPQELALANLPPPLSTERNESNQQTEILALLKADSEARSLQGQQQSESVRYLNELNQWLETFVNNGTSQIQEMSNLVQRLCGELGVLGGNQHNPGGVLAELRNHLALTREGSTIGLQESLESLKALMLNASSSPFTAESVAAMVETQKVNQEGLMKALTAELSTEIRGERLRFVEAMKEATAINVQTHVEQFKRELTREVMMMVAEASRLQKEKQAMEIHKEKKAMEELMQFYSRQGQNQVRSTFLDPLQS